MTKMTGFFVTGTDTEVGKTLVSGALIFKLRKQGKQAIGFKPVVAGTYQSSSGSIHNEDLETLRIASQLAPGQFNLSSYVFDMPVAPHLAAANKGITIDLDVIMQALDKIQKHVIALLLKGLADS